LKDPPIVWVRTFFKGGDLSNRPVDGRSSFLWGQQNQFSIPTLPATQALDCHPLDTRKTFFLQRDRFLLQPFHLVWFSASDRRDLERLKAEPVSFTSQFGCIFLNFIQFCKIGTAFVSKLNQMEAMIKDLYKSRSFEAK
jgi:hypothetical protein